MQERLYELKQVRALIKINGKTNLTQKDTAKFLNIHHITYGKLEQNPSRLTLAQAHLLAEAAGIGVQQIKI